MKQKSIYLALTVFLLLGGIWLWAAPASAQFGLGKVLDKVGRAADAQREWSIDEEKSIGEATAAKMIAIFALFEQPQTQKYVTLVGRAVSQFAPRQNFDYRYGILFGLEVLAKALQSNPFTVISPGSPGPAPTR